MNRTLLDECFRVQGRTKWYTAPDEIQRDLDTFTAFYNFRRTHQGYRVAGRTPDLLRDYLLELAEGKKSDDLLFGYHDRNWPRKWVGKICKAAEVPRVTAHGMRGLHGTLAVDTGISAHAVAAALGHESVTTTLQSYAKAGAGTSARQDKVLRVLSGGVREKDSAA